MIDPTYKTYEYTLAAGGDVRLNRVANTVICLEAPEKFEIGFNEGPLSEFERGIKYSSKVAFRQIRLRNNGDTEQTVKLGIAVGDVSDSRLSLSDGVTIDGLPFVRPNSPAILQSGKVIAPPGVRTQMRPSSPDRYGVALSNYSNETLFIGGSDVAAFEGLPLPPGSSATLPTLDEIHAWNGGAGDATVGFVEVLY